MSVSIRLAQPDRDAAGILEIYKPYIEHTAIPFEYDVPAAETFERRVADIAAQFPYLVLEIDGEMIGYAYAHRQAERAAFDWNAELSIYLKQGFAGRGIGRPLYRLLETLLEMQGYVNFFGVITGSNKGSIAMHERMGYRQIAVHGKTGWKFGAWHDTVWMHRRVRDGAPQAIIPVHALDQNAMRQEIEKTEKIVEEKWNPSGTSCQLPFQGSQGEGSR